MFRVAPKWKFITFSNIAPVFRCKLLEKLRIYPLPSSEFYDEYSHQLIVLIALHTILAIYELDGEMYFSELSLIQVIYIP